MSVVAGDSQGVCLLRAQSQHDEVLHAALAEFFKVRVVPKIHPDVLFPGAMGGSLAFTIVALDDDVPTKLEQVLKKIESDLSRGLLSRKLNDNTNIATTGIDCDPTGSSIFSICGPISSKIFLN